MPVDSCLATQATDLSLAAPHFYRHTSAALANCCRMPIGIIGRGRVPVPQTHERKDLAVGTGRRNDRSDKLTKVDQVNA